MAGSEAERRLAVQMEVGPIAVAWASRVTWSAPSDTATVPTVFAGPTGQTSHCFANPSGVAKEPGGRTSSDVFASWIRTSASQISPGSCAKRKCSVPVPSTLPGTKSNVWASMRISRRSSAIHGAKEEPRGDRLSVDVDLWPAACVLDADRDSVSGHRQEREQEQRGVLHYCRLLVAVMVYGGLALAMRLDLDREDWVCQAAVAVGWDQIA